MKYILTTVIMLVSISAVLAQVTIIKDLNSFDKLVIEGEVKEMRLSSNYRESPLLKIEGVDEKFVQATVEAGVLYLKLESKEPATVKVYNDRLKRISGPENMNITGAEVIGGDKGNYLVVSFDHQNRHFDSWTSGDNGFQFHIPNIDIDIPEMDIAVDIPAMDFDFDFDFGEGLSGDHNFDFDMKFDKEWKAEFEYNWENHKDEIKLWSQELTEEVQKALKEAQDELKGIRKKD